jgi:hypothetical protein
MQMIATSTETTKLSLTMVKAEASRRLIQKNLLEILEKQKSLLPSDVTQIQKGIQAGDFTSECSWNSHGGVVTGPLWKEKLMQCRIINKDTVGKLSDSSSTTTTSLDTSGDEPASPTSLSRPNYTSRRKRAIFPSTPMKQQQQQQEEEEEEKEEQEEEEEKEGNDEEKEQQEEDEDIVLMQFEDDFVDVDNVSPAVVQQVPSISSPFPPSTSTVSPVPVFPDVPTPTPAATPTSSPVKEVKSTKGMYSLLFLCIQFICCSRST